MLRIHRQENGEVVFTISGQIDKEHIAELEALIAAEGKDRRITLDLKDMTLTGEDGIAFLARCEAAGIELANCDPYVREWITIQNKGS
jgi:anti-anti-sigma regulatory factor